MPTVNYPHVLQRTQVLIQSPSPDLVAMRVRDEHRQRLALRGFKRLSLKVGESQEISFDLSPRDLSFVDHDGNRKVMSGAYKLSIGSTQPVDAIASSSVAFTVSTEVAIPK